MATKKQKDPELLVVLKDKKSRMREIKELQKKIKFAELEKERHEKNFEKQHLAHERIDAEIDTMEQMIDNLNASGIYGEMIQRANKEVERVGASLNKVNRLFKEYDKVENSRPTKIQFEDYKEAFRVARDRIARYHNILKTLQ